MTVAGVALARMVVSGLAVSGVTAVRVPCPDVVAHMPGMGAAQKHLSEKAEETDQKQCRTD